MSNVLILAISNQNVELYGLLLLLLLVLFIVIILNGLREDMQSNTQAILSLKQELKDIAMALDKDSEKDKDVKKE